MLPFEKLNAWQVCHRLVLAVYEVSKEFPDSEKYGLTSQSRRAAASAAANIAEGSASRSRPEFRRFLTISIKSLRELAYWLMLARDLKLLDRKDWQSLERLRGRAGFLTWRLYESQR
ncbi:MAG: four helix bundle protein [Gemmatimonadetes bacterium]|nr:four helix bundle protein [Gemmatimonadota bacterium]